MGDGSIERRSGRIIQLPLVESKIMAVAIPSDIPNALAFAGDLRSSVDEASGVLIIDVSKALLVLAGYSADIKVSLKWQNPLPHRDLASAQYAVTMKEIGVSSGTLLEESGYDAEEEMKRTQEELQQKMENMPQMFPQEVPGAPPLPGQQPPAPTPQPQAPQTPLLSGGKQ